MNKAVREAAGPELDLELEAKFQIVSGSVFKTPGTSNASKCPYSCDALCCISVSRIKKTVFSSFCLVLLKSCIYNIFIISPL